MRFAVKTRPEHTTWQQMRDVWVAADQFEIFESAWHWDHFYPLSGDMAGPNLEAWTPWARWRRRPSGSGSAARSPA